MAEKNIYDFESTMQKKLIKSEADLLGKIAFAHYLMDKLTFIENYKNTSEQEGRYPGQREIKIFEISVLDDVKRYQHTAAEELAAFITGAVRKEREKERKKKKWRIWPQ